MPTVDTRSRDAAPAPGEVMTLEDVARRTFSGVPLCVIGQPIRHSISPQMHNTALADMARVDGDFARWTYHRLEAPASRLSEALQLLASKGFVGVNLTIPHKVEAFRHVRHVDPAARALGALNTLQFRDGDWMGYNTDGAGFEAAVGEQLQVALADRDVIILGAGGAARAIAAQCLLRGCRSLWIGNRSVERLQELLDVLKQVESRASIHPFDLTRPDFDALPTDALVVNATSLGLKPDDNSPLAVDRLRGQPTVYDTTYGSHRSQLVADAESAGLRAANGLSMLIWQGVRALEIWTGQAVPVNAMRSGALSALSHHA